MEPKTTERQIEELLKLLVTSFPRLTITEDLIRSWSFILHDENPVELLAGARYLCKTKTAEFIPTPAALLAANREISAPLCDAESCWSAGPGRPKTNHEKETWRLWGGSERWGMLPDPRTAQGSDFQTTAFARKEFIELYRARQQQQDKAQAHLTAADAVKSIEHLRQFGIESQKLLKQI